MSLVGYSLEIRIRSTFEDLCLLLNFLDDPPKLDLEQFYKLLVSYRLQNTMACVFLEFVRGINYISELGGCPTICKCNAACNLQEYFEYLSQPSLGEDHFLYPLPDS